MFKYYSKILIVVSFAFMQGCKHAPLSIYIPQKNELELKDNKETIVFVPKKNSASYLSFTHNRRFKWNGVTQLTMFKEDFIKNPNMSNVVFEAKVMNGQKILKDFKGERLGENAQEAKENMLRLIIPFINPQEEVLITIKYDWMDVKNFPVLYLQKENQAEQTFLSVSIPYGTNLHFIVTHNSQPIEYAPETLVMPKNLWINDENKNGLGTEFIFDTTKLTLQPNQSAHPADFLQIFLAFEAPFAQEKRLFLNDWKSVSAMIYQKIETYDLAGKEMKKFIEEKIKIKETLEEQISGILSFLQGIQKLSSDQPYLFQNMQPANRTFDKKMGSVMDIVLLAKAMFSNINIYSELLIATNKYKNPQIENFYTANLFDKPLLAILLGDKTYYFDPSSSPELWFSLSDEIAGQKALIIRKNDGKVIFLPKNL